MGKSKCSCFRILSCSDGDSPSANELLRPEFQATSYKCSWSFRKRLPIHRVLSKNVVLEPESVGYTKIGTEAVTNSSNTAKNICGLEQAFIHLSPSEEELSVGPRQSSAAMDSEVSAIFAQNSFSNNENFQESAVIIIQTAIRGYLAKIQLRKVKYIIKLQAAARGHLVRVQAVGTLRCILAISKLQAIVRGHLACRLKDGLPDIKGNGYRCEGRFYSTKKLLTNRFSQQLLVSTANTRTIRIKCDPLKSDSAWIWLERWMMVITADVEEKKEQNMSYADTEDVKISMLICNEKKENGSADSKLEPRALALSFEKKDDLNSKSHCNVQSQSDDGLSDICFSSIEKDELSQKTNDYFSFKTDCKENNLSFITKREQSGPLEIEAQKVAMRSRRPQNPSFAAAQSKFKELSVISRNVKFTSSLSSSNEDCADGARFGNEHSHMKKSNETGFTENFPSHDSLIQVASSECGTEISISSTLDSSDRSETECGEIILEISSIDKYSATTYSNNAFTRANKCNESQKTQSNKQDETVMYKSLLSDLPDTSPPAASEARGLLEITNFQQDKTSIEGTPRSQNTALDPCAIASEFSVNAGSRCRDDNMPTRSDKRLVSRAISKSITRDSAEHLLNESKNEKKRRSAVSRADLDDEPRMSNSNSSSLPSYMQATKSARAKVYASISPKSSPDLHEKDDHTKKRHSLPIGNVKQDLSPPKKQLAPRVQQTPKSNDVHALHTSERRWQR